MHMSTPDPKGNRVQRVATDYGSVLLDETRGEYFHLNSTGARIFELLSDDGASELEAARMLADEYDIPLEQAEVDVSRLCAQLRERGLL